MASIHTHTENQTPKLEEFRKRQLIPVSLFIQRCTAFFIAILFVQFIHLNFIASGTFSNNITLVAVGLIGILGIQLIKSGVDKNTQWFQLDLRLFSILFIISFFVTIIFSRTPYVLSVLNDGLFATRNNSSIGNIGWHSGFSILFYPLCMVLVFVNASARRYFIFIAMMWSVMAIDFIFIGTRGSPFFVLGFHALMTRRKIITTKGCGLMSVFIIFSVFLFDYQTRYGRASSAEGWSWENTLRHTWITTTLPVSEWRIQIFAEQFPLMLPVTYVLQYITHSITVFEELISAGVFKWVGSFIYTRYEFCLVLGCDKLPLLDEILLTNKYAGLYQTMWGIFLFDFGWLGAFVVILFLTLLFKSSSAHLKKMSAFRTYALTVFVFSSIENYFYNGLGLNRFIVFMLLVYVLSHRISLSKN